MKTYKQQTWGSSLLLWVVILCVLIITAAVVTQAVIQSIAAFYILAEAKEINNGIKILHESTEIVHTVSRYVKAVEDGTAHLDLAEVVRKSVPDTEEEASARLMEIGNGVRSASSVAVEVKTIGIVEMIRPLLQVAVKLTGRPETAVFGNALSVLGEYLAKNAEAGNVDIAFSMLKDVVNLGVGALKDKDNRETLSRAKARVDDILTSNRTTQAANDVADLIHEAKNTGSMASVSSGMAKLGEFTTFLRNFQDDFRRGGISISLPGFYRDTAHEIAHENP